MTDRTYRRNRPGPFYQWQGYAKTWGMGRGTIQFGPTDIQKDGTTPPDDGTYGTDDQGKFDTLDFDGLHDSEIAYLNFVLPYDFATDGRILLYGVINGTGTLSWKGTVNALTPHDGNKTAADSDDPDAAGTSFTEEVANAADTANELFWVDIDIDAALVTEGAEPDDLICVKFYRDQADASDTIGADFKLIKAVFEYARG